MFPGKLGKMDKPIGAIDIDEGTKVGKTGHATGIYFAFFEFFDHYLLGKPRPEWMDKGVTYLDRGKRDVAPMFKKKTPETSAPTQDK